MLSSFRNLSKSKFGSVILVLFLLMIVASFAVADISNLRSSAFGLGSGTLAKAGDEQVTERDLQDVFGRLLSRVREQNPDATGATLAPQFDAIVEELINQRLLSAFATENKLLLSRRLVDAEIAKIPGTAGLNGAFDPNAYAQWLNSQKLTDALVRRQLSADLIQRLLLAPAAVNARMPAGVARQYASIQLEQRSGEVAAIVIDAFKGGLAPTPGDIQAFYDQNKTRYMVPEQRVLRFATVEAAKLAVPPPSEAEIAAAYKANAARYAGKQTRTISQVVVPSQAQAAGIAAKARAGAALPNAIDLGAQAKADFERAVGKAVADAAFAAPANGIAGPVRSDLGWHVLKVGPVQGEAGKTLAQVRGELVAALTEQKRKEALADVYDKLENAIADDASLPEVAVAAGLTLTETPLLMANGTSRADPGFKLPADLGPALKSMFEMAADDEPVVEDLGQDKGLVLVGPGRIVPASPAPLADIRDRVRADWINKKASDLARASAAGIAAKVARGMPMAQAIKEAGPGAAGPRNVTARRIQLTQRGGAPAPIRVLFSLAEGKSRMIGDPEGRGFYVVRNIRIVPGDAGAQPGLIAQVQLGYSQAMSQELAEQFVGAVRKEIGVKRDDKAIAAAKTRLTSN